MAVAACELPAVKIFNQHYTRPFWAFFILGDQVKYLSVKYLILILALLALNANSLNIKRDINGDRTVLIDDPTCTKQIVAQGPLGNVRVTCTETTVTPPPTVYSCAPLTRINVDVQRNYDAPGWSFTAPNMARGQAYVMAFRTGAASAAPNLLAAQEYAGGVVTKYIRISTSPCDFTVPPGYVQSGGTTKVLFTVGIPADGMQTLQPNTQYFVNLKNMDPRDPDQDSCTSDQCGFVLTFYR